MKDNEFRTKLTLNCSGKILTIDRAIVMGIINATPDSFHSSSRVDEKTVLQMADQHISEGAQILDIGGYSSRPNGADISIEEEIKRVVPVIKSIREKHPEVLISLDTFRSEVLESVLQFRIDFVNDISAGMIDEKLPKIAGENGIPYIAMHMRGTPQTMMTDTNYNNLVMDVNFYFSERIASLKKCGIKDIIIDPGFGFSKTTEQNFELLKQMNLLQVHQLPILAGLSRKSMIYKTLNNSPSKALNGTTALNMIALQQGAKILRVHDVKEAVECIELHHRMNA